MHSGTQQSQLTPDNSSERVDEIVDLIESSGQIAIDTEFIGEGHYRPLLCLVQIGVRDGEDLKIYLIDPLKPLDHRRLARTLADPAIEVLLHAGKHDVALLKRVWSTEITNVFDTQVAAGFAGFGAQVGYSRLVNGLLNRSLAKTASFSYWNRRPLSREQLAYAAEDVEHLHELSDRIKSRLNRLGRLEWAQEECLSIAATDDTKIPDQAYLRVQRASRLSPKELAVAKELASWREIEAAERDSPVQHVVSDIAIVELSKQRPRSVEALRDIRGIQRSAVKNHSSQLLAAIERGVSSEPVIQPSRPNENLDSNDAALVPLVEALVKQRAKESQIAYELLTNRSVITQLISRVRRDVHDQNTGDNRLLNGWRYELAGREVVELLQGKLALQIGSNGLCTRPAT